MPPVTMIDGMSRRRVYSPPALPIPTGDGTGCIMIGRTICFSDISARGEWTALSRGKLGCLDVIIKIFGSRRLGGPSGQLKDEILATKWLAEMNCPHVARYVTAVDGHYPSYTEHYLVMMEVPGRPLHDLSENELTQNDSRIMRALTQAYNSIRNSGLIYGKMHLESIFYDEVRGECYGVDPDHWTACETLHYDCSTWSLGNRVFLRWTSQAAVAQERG
ncbi:hypothetical protein CERZMDRAFT_89196 [Cercospora zeae-maydis SCOH1-5]|uniref:Protein kinase domain-containing protein n=1 Tax=Cercospora zeae-maydis SCOH1-5 TaxID=717836 RepID=A0A6A6EWB9_9PEZI|nr:hypothetical protein CERZMDRAFT_89196 [Cercospora zeae-maydis SCOH1-5]